MVTIRKINLLIFIGILFFSCDDIFEETDISMESVEILAPKEGSSIEVNKVNFNWVELSGANSYNIQIAKPSFENATQIILDSLVVRDSLDQIQTQLSHTLLNGVYEWRIKAENSGFTTAFTTSKFTINGDPNIDIVAPNTPQLVLPSNNSTQSETQVDFSWTRADIAGTAERDSIFIFTDVNLTTLKENGLGTNKTFRATLESSTYYWFVKAYDASNESESSSVFKFTVN